MRGQGSGRGKPRPCMVGLRRGSVGEGLAPPVVSLRLWFLPGHAIAVLEDLIHHRVTAIPLPQWGRLGTMGALTCPARIL